VFVQHVHAEELLGVEMNYGNTGVIFCALLQFTCSSAACQQHLAGW
jgi:hypothetical protein